MECVCVGLWELGHLSHSPVLCVGLGTALLLIDLPIQPFYLAYQCNFLFPSVHAIHPVLILCIKLWAAYHLCKV